MAGAELRWDHCLLSVFWIVVLKISHNMAKLSICMGEEFGYLIDAITLTILGIQLNERLT